MYILNQLSQIVDAEGRLMVGIDGTPIIISSLDDMLAKRLECNISDKDLKVNEKVVVSTRGRKGGYALCKAPTMAAMDLPLCAVREGFTTGTLWYVGEFLAKTGNLAKRWIMFEQQFVDAAKGDAAKLSAWAWNNVVAYRVGKNITGQKNPEEDALALSKMTELPSVVHKREKDARGNANRRAKRAQAGKKVRAAKKTVKKSF